MISEVVHNISVSAVSVKERVEGFYSRIKDDPLHAFLFIQDKSALLNELSTHRNGRAGKLSGIIFAIKDNICVSGMPCTAGSRMLESFIAPYDAFVISIIKKEGGIIIGKTNLDEFAMGSSTEYSAFGPTKNPLDNSVVPGGSSGGSAVAVAAHLADIALGSDTGGSVRLPAAFTGTIGFKPSYGVLSRFGLIAFASSLDQIGIHARSIEDIEYILPILADKDPMDATSAGLLSKEYHSNQKDKITLGVPEEIFNGKLEFETKSLFLKALKKLSDKTFSIKPVAINDWNQYLRAYYIIACAEAASNLARYDGVRYGLQTEMKNSFNEWIALNRSTGFGHEVKRRIAVGNYVLSAKYRKKFYIRAMNYRYLLGQEINKIFAEVDVILTPTSPFFPFKYEEKTKDPSQMLETDLFTVIANLIYAPAISIPFQHESQQFPIGIQLISARFTDLKLLKMARQIMDALNG